MGEVINLNISNTSRHDPETVLNGAIEEKLGTVLVLGTDREGDLFIASSENKYGDILLLLELAKREILAQATD